MSWKIHDPIFVVSRLPGVQIAVVLLYIRSSEVAFTDKLIRESRRQVINKDQRVDALVPGTGNQIAHTEVPPRFGEHAASSADSILGESTDIFIFLDALSDVTSTEIVVIKQGLETNQRYMDRQ